MERFILLSVLLWTTTFTLADGFCNRGFQVATRYHDCWQHSKFVNKYPDLYERHEILDAAFLEKYATFMCRVVKPKALECFKKEVKECPNKAQLIEIADKSGGACKGKDLNPFFKAYVINHLVPVTGDKESPCFTIGENAYDKCYIAAGKQVMESELSEEIAQFHKVAELFFETYWDCLTDLYKSRAKECPHWQIPMLLVLQKTALPSLFGMHLKPKQVFKLELQSHLPDLAGNGTNSTEESETGCAGGNKKKMYLLMQILSQKPDVTSGGGKLLVELSNLDSDKPEIHMEGSEKESDEEIMKFVQVLSGPNTEYTLKERRRRRQHEKKTNKQLENISSRLKGKEAKALKAKALKAKALKAKGTKSKGKKSRSKRKKLQRKPVSRDIYDKMI